MTTEGKRRFSSVFFQTENWIENLLSNTDNTKMSLLYPEFRIQSAAPFANRSVQVVMNDFHGTERKSNITEENKRGIQPTH